MRLEKTLRPEEPMRLVELDTGRDRHWWSQILVDPNTGGDIHWWS